MTTGQTRAPRTRPKDRRAQIALAAAELFCERGYPAVGIADIAAAVGITGPAVYRHFPSKYAILVHATRELSAAALDATAPDEAPAPPHARLDAVLRGLARLAVKRRRMGGSYQWDGRFLEPADRADLRQSMTILLDRITAPLAALRPGLTAESAALLARGVMSIMISLSTHRAAVAAGPAESLLYATGWQVLLADMPPPAHNGMRPSAGLPVGDGVGHAPPASRRETIMAEAVRLFHARGFHAVSMEDIATASGTRPSSLYRHFPSKADLLAAVYYRATDQVIAAATAALAEAKDPRAGLHGLIYSYVDLVFGQSELVTVYQAENTNLPPADRHELRKAQRLHVEEWVRLLGELRPDLTAAECRVLSHAGLTLIADLARRARFDRTAGADDAVAHLALSALTPA